ncbi:vesicle-associated membrane protein 727-like [Camellia sinensis]|uniref:vesicle-associated membrane protein 727-like n=1 Tax=Camellia sinensis TaxID=4442 RepID=UPI0010367AAA|nr:vesicle-associated membrane protein 727-like [Camellia sinensis]
MAAWDGGHIGVGGVVMGVAMDHGVRVKDNFKQCYGASIRTDGLDSIGDEDDDEEDDLFPDRFSIAYNLDREFGPRIKEHMQYCMNHPDEISKLSKLKTQITEVKGIMMDNIEKVLDRGEKIELLVDKTENLQFQADSFQRQGRQLRRKMWLQNLQMKLMVMVEDEGNTDLKSKARNNLSSSATDSMADCVAERERERWRGDRTRNTITCSRWC